MSKEPKGIWSKVPKLKDDSKNNSAVNSRNTSGSSTPVRRRNASNNNSNSGSPKPRNRYHDHRGNDNINKSLKNRVFGKTVFRKSKRSSNVNNTTIIPTNVNDMKIKIHNEQSESKVIIDVDDEVRKAFKEEQQIDQMLFNSLTGEEKKRRDAIMRKAKKNIWGKHMDVTVSCTTENIIIPGHEKYVIPFDLLNKKVLLSRIELYNIRKSKDMKICELCNSEIEKEYLQMRAADEASTLVTVCKCSPTIKKMHGFLNTLNTGVSKYMKDNNITDLNDIANADINKLKLSKKLPTLTLSVHDAERGYVRTRDNVETEALSIRAMKDNFENIVNPSKFDLQTHIYYIIRIYPDDEPDLKLFNTSVVDSSTRKCENFVTHERHAGLHVGNTLYEDRSNGSEYYIIEEGNESINNGWFELSSRIKYRNVLIKSAYRFYDISPETTYVHKSEEKKMEAIYYPKSNKLEIVFEIPAELHNIDDKNSKEAIRKSKDTLSRIYGEINNWMKNNTMKASRDIYNKFILFNVPVMYKMLLDNNTSMDEKNIFDVSVLCRVPRRCLVNYDVIKESERIIYHTEPSLSNHTNDNSETYESDQKNHNIFTTPYKCGALVFCNKHVYYSGQMTNSFEYIGYIYDYDPGYNMSFKAAVDNDKKEIILHNILYIEARSFWKYDLWDYIKKYICRKLNNMGYITKVKFEIMNNINSLTEYDITINRSELTLLNKYSNLRLNFEKESTFDVRNIIRSLMLKVNNDTNSKFYLIDTTTIKGKKFIIDKISSIAVIKDFDNIIEQIKIRRYDIKLDPEISQMINVAPDRKKKEYKKFNVPKSSGDKSKTDKGNSNNNQYSLLWADMPNGSDEDNEDSFSDSQEDTEEVFTKSNIKGLNDYEIDETIEDIPEVSSIIIENNIKYNKLLNNDIRLESMNDNVGNLSPYMSNLINSNKNNSIGEENSITLLIFLNDPFNTILKPSDRKIYKAKRSYKTSIANHDENGYAEYSSDEDYDDEEYESNNSDMMGVGEDNGIDDLRQLIEMGFIEGGNKDVNEVIAYSGDKLGNKYDNIRKTNYAKETIAENYNNYKLSNEEYSKLSDIIKFYKKVIVYVEYIDDNVIKFARALKDNGVSYKTIDLSNFLDIDTNSSGYIIMNSEYSDGWHYSGFRHINLM